MALNSNTKVWVSAENGASFGTDLPTLGELATAVAAINGTGGQAFPVGSIFTATVATDPATLLGYGTWEAFGAGRVLVGFSDGDPDFGEALQTGGTKTHTLTVNEIPAHSHTKTSSNAAGNSGTSWTRGTGTQSTQTSDAAGGGAAHPNLQPYIVVHLWRRTA